MEEKDNPYNIVKGTADDRELEQYRVCFVNNGTERILTNLQWLHQKNLVKANTIYYAMHDEDVAGIYTALPVLFKIGDEVKPALQSIDTLTDVAHRGKGLFPKLAKKLYADAADSNCALVYGFPNESSGPGFFNKLQWTSFGEVPFLLKPLNVFYFINKILKRKKRSDVPDGNYSYNAPATVAIGSDTEIKLLNKFEAEFDTVWARVSKKIKVCANRSADYMNWRFVDKPDEVYYRYGLYANGNLQGVVVFTIKRKHGGLIGYLMELIYNPQNEDAGKQLLRFASKQCRKQQADTILAWSIPECFNYNVYKKCGYYTLPEKLRPQQLFFGVRPFDEKNAQMILNVKNWYISYADSDTG
ncbi:MAG: GNAT family N-acetyltransferase [Ferruginibacter sp.]